MQKLIILVLISLFSAGCSLFPDVYTVPRFQGNVVEQKMIDQLAPGMSREQVLFIMGTPLIEDPFHSDRWDYVYTTQPTQNERTQEQITLLFTGDQLTGLKGDFKPEPPPEGVTVEDVTIEEEVTVEEDIVVNPDGTISENVEVDEEISVSEKPVKTPSNKGEDTTLHTGGSSHPAPKDGEVTETHSVATTPAPAPTANQTDTATKAIQRKDSTPTPTPTVLEVFIESR